MYVICFGFDQRQRPRNHYFTTLAEANAAASAYFRRTGVVVGIEKK